MVEDVATLEGPVEAVQQDYFGTDVTHKCYLPDGASYIEHKELSEGDRRRYMNATNKDVRIARQSGDMHLKMAAGDDRYHLLKTAIVGWNLVRQGESVRFTSDKLDRWLAEAPPHIVDIVEKDVRKRNPWLVSDVTIEDIDKQIAELQELREQRVKEEEGKGS
jgi:hypothetical protein